MRGLGGQHLAKAELEFETETEELQGMGEGLASFFGEACMR